MPVVGPPVVAAPGVGQPPPVDGGPSVPPIVLPPVPVGLPSPLLAARFTSPDGSTWDLDGDVRIRTRPGVAGLGVPDPVATLQDLARGGAVVRYSHMPPRPLTWPVQLHHTDQVAFSELCRAFRRSLRATMPAAGAGRPGVLRVTRVDSSWLELGVVCLGGLAGDGYDPGLLYDDLVLSLLAPDPWWYGQQTIGIPFPAGGSASYLAPYESTGPTRSLGVETVEVDSDDDVQPVWTLTGPFSSAQVGVVGGDQFTYSQAVPSGQSRIIDTAAGTVIGTDGTSYVGALAWPSSRLFDIPPGEVDLSLTLNGAGAGAGVQMTYRPKRGSAL